MKTGVFDLPMEKYLKAHGINQSGLKRFARSPAHYKAYIDNPEPPTAHQIMGKIEHLAVFEPHLLNGSHYVKPTTYENKKGEIKKWNANATEAKEWIAAHQDRHIISQADYAAIEGMCKSIFAHPAAAKALSQGKAEQSLFCEDPDTGMQIKARADWLSGNANVDLKKCQDASPMGFSRTVANFGYDLQAAQAMHISRILNLPYETFLFIAVEDQFPFAVGVYQLDEASIGVGESKRQRLMLRYAECVSNDSWPAYSRNVEFLSLPRWAASSEQNAALLDDSPALPALEV